MYITKIEKTCPICKKNHFIKVNAYNGWKKRNIQTMYSTSSTAERKQLISGICSECQKEIFGVA